MKRVIPVNATGVYVLASGLEGFTGKVSVQIVVASGTPTFSANFRARATPPRNMLAEVPNTPAVPLDATSPLLAYRDTSAVAETAGATAITAVGLFEVNVTNIDVALHVSALASGTLAIIVGNAVVS